MDQAADLAEVAGQEVDDPETASVAAEVAEEEAAPVELLLSPRLMRTQLNPYPEVGVEEVLEILDQLEVPEVIMVIEVGQQRAQAQTLILLLEHSTKRSHRKDP